MVDRFRVSMVGLFGAALVFSLNAFAQSSSTQTWPDPVPNRPPVAEKDKKAAPRRTLVGMWGSRLGNQAKGVQLRPNDDSPENERPYTPYGRQLYQSHKALEGVDAVPPAQTNDPRVSCEPLGFPLTSGCWGPPRGNASCVVQAEDLDRCCGRPGASEALGVDLLLGRLVVAIPGDGVFVDERVEPLDH